MGYLAPFQFEFPNLVVSAGLPAGSMGSTELRGCGLHIPVGQQEVVRPPC